MPKAKLGQHFLKDLSALQFIAESLDIKRGDFVLEIGPGHGELTLPILEIAESVGAEVAAIEMDSELAKQLGGETAGRLHIIEGDVRRKLGEAVSLAGSRPLKIVGNIPYYLTGFLLRLIGELPRRPALSIFTIQKEVAERAAAKAPEMNRLAASLGGWAEPKVLKIIPKGSFSPSPEVDSAVLALYPAKNPAKDMPAYFETVRRLFSQPRKTISNNLRGKGGPSAKAQKAIESLGLRPDARPQDLSVENIAALSSLS